MHRNKLSVDQEREIGKSGRVEDLGMYTLFPGDMSYPFALKLSMWTHYATRLVAPAQLSQCAPRAGGVGRSETLAPA